MELKYSSVVKSLFEADEYGNELFDSLPIIIKEEGLKWADRVQHKGVDGSV